MYECNAHIQSYTCQMHINVSIHIRKDNFLLTYQKYTPEISPKWWSLQDWYIGISPYWLQLFEVSVWLSHSESHHSILRTKYVEAVHRYCSLTVWLTFREMLGGWKVTLDVGATFREQKVGEIVGPQACWKVDWNPFSGLSILSLPETNELHLINGWLEATLAFLFRRLTSSQLRAVSCRGCIEKTRQKTRTVFFCWIFVYLQ